jgi:spore photoproduct lyase
MKLPRPIKRILIEKEAVGYDMTRRILARLPSVPVEVIQARETLKASGHNRASWLPEAKTTLLLAIQRGPFWRPCPGTKDYICCGYQVLQVTLNCPMDCTYCVLQGYVNIPAITIFVNVEDLFNELETRWAESPKRVWRLGTGEFGDSLALDDLMGLNEGLISRLAGQRRAVLEIKSKWPYLDHLLSLGPNPQVIFAWSLNPPGIISGEEKLAASLKMRLIAASRAAAAGFRIAFHFDH